MIKILGKVFLNTSKLLEITPLKVVMWIFFQASLQSNVLLHLHFFKKITAVHPLSFQTLCFSSLPSLRSGQFSITGVVEVITYAAECMRKHACTPTSL